MEYQFRYNCQAWRRAGIDGGRLAWRRSLQALRNESEYGRDLFARHVELLDYFLDAQVLKILNDGRDG
jgi:hypothetical protein